MNRLQKKCFVASAGAHLLLLVVLFIGPGFLRSKSAPDDLPLLTFVPAKTVDELISGGGNPNAPVAPSIPLPHPPQPQAQPPPQPIREPEPQKIHEPDPLNEVKPSKPEEASVEPPKERQARKIEISTKLVTRQKEPIEDKRAREEIEARQQAKAIADARRRLARQIGKAADQIGSELSGSTAIEMQMRGPGGGGASYANFFQAVKSVYDRAWVLSVVVEDDNALTVATVTIARDGKVVSHRITRPSGDAAVDHSVQMALERVTYAAPLPDTEKEDTRTVSISFSVKAKRLLG